MKRPLLLLSLLLAPAAPAGEIYKWVDEQGQTHFGETMPEKYRKAAQPVDPQPQNVIRVETPRYRAPEGSSRPAAPAPAGEAPVPPPASAPPSCEEQMRRYAESQACFARYRNANGSLRAEAAACQDVPMPSCQ